MHASLYKKASKTLLFTALSALALPAFAENAALAAIDKADTAWVLTASLLVFFMTIPGIALFYAGMVR